MRVASRRRGRSLCAEARTINEGHGTSLKATRTCCHLRVLCLRVWVYYSRGARLVLRAPARSLWSLVKLEVQQQGILRGNDGAVHGTTSELGPRSASKRSISTQYLTRTSERPPGSSLTEVYRVKPSNDATRVPANYTPQYGPTKRTREAESSFDDRLGEI